MPRMGERFLSDYNELFNEAEAAFLVDDFGECFFAEDNPVDEALPPAVKLSSLIPSLSSMPLELNIAQSSSAIPETKLNIALSSGAIPETKIDAKRHYRQTVAIPRYLAKRKRRRWDKELMHPSRSEAAHRRKRNGGQFSVTAATFLPVSSARCP